ncbi:MAG: hypothetical protein JW969_16720 [Spirochaetales bacterium]|nr:hypothetical protein [Spirochaetales bacterium]
MPRPKTLCIILLLIFFVSLPLAAQFKYLKLDVYCELEPFVNIENGEYPLSKETAVNRILEEARVFVSAMIYGYKFVYTPADSVRKVDDYFTLTPISEIKWGDKNLTVLETYTKNKRLYATVKYELRDFQADRISAWQSTGLPEIGGIGKGDLFKGYKQKFAAFEQAIKESIRNHLREAVFNKPREIRGEVYITDCPKTIIKAGNYITKVTLKLKVASLIPYKIY